MDEKLGRGGDKAFSIRHKLRLDKKAEVIYCALLSNFNMYEATVNSFVSVKTNLDDQSCLKFWIFK